MSIFLFLLLVLLCSFLIFVIRAWLWVRNARKQSNAFFEQMRRSQEQAANPDADPSAQGFGEAFDPLSFIFMHMAGAQADTRQQRTPQETPDKPVKPKKISPEVGEYVAFQEVEVAVQVTDDKGNTTEIYESESQIVDVEWVDLPPSPEK